MARTTFGTTTALTYPLDGSDVSSSPTNNIPSTALQHAYLKEANFGLAIGDAPVSKEVFIHMANRVEQIQGFHVGCIDTGSSASITFDLLKDGVSVLSAPVTVANTDADRTKKNGTIIVPTLADNEILTVKIIESSNTGMQGPFAQVVIIAAASPI